MVKNTRGGSGSKSLSRKSQITAENTADSIMKPTTPFEFFAIVTHFFGNTASVIDSSNKTFRCFIRGKFKGRNKRNYIVAPGKLVLVSKREFESETSTNVDLLTVYDSHDISLLMNFPSFNLSSLFHTFSSSYSQSSATTVSEDIIFDYSSSTNYALDNIDTGITEENTSNDNIDEEFFNI